MNKTTNNNGFMVLNLNPFGQSNATTFNNVLLEGGLYGYDPSKGFNNTDDELTKIQFRHFVETAFRGVSSSSISATADMNDHILTKAIYDMYMINKNHQSNIYSPEVMDAINLIIDSLIDKFNRRMRKDTMQQSASYSDIYHAITVSYHRPTFGKRMTDISYYLMSSTDGLMLEAANYGSYKFDSLTKLLSYEVSNDMARCGDLSPNTDSERDILRKAYDALYNELSLICLSLSEEVSKCLSVLKNYAHQLALQTNFQPHIKDMDTIMYMHSIDDGNITIY